MFHPSITCGTIKNTIILAIGGVDEIPRGKEAHRKVNTRHPCRRPHWHWSEVHNHWSLRPRRCQSVEQEASLVRAMF